MMCDICNEGGQVLGPFLKPMTHLVHTEYLLAGRTTRDVREVLRDTMFAATVTGAPVENACRLIRKYETEGRGYYGAALALLGRDADGRADRGQPDRDPHRRRLARRRAQGQRRRDPGARLRPGVRGRRDPRQGRRHPHRVRAGRGAAPPAEGHRRRSPATRTCSSRSAPATSGSVEVLAHRPGRRRRRRPSSRAGRAVILEGEDDFVNMLRHVLDGARHDARPSCRTRTTPTARSTATTWSSSGPARATRATATTRRSRRSGPRPSELLATGQPFLSVCLGHQVLCDRLGIPLAYKDIVFQGTQSRVDLAPVLAREEVVGFYNTFVGRPDGAAARRRREWRPTRRPATCTCSPARTTAGCSSTPSRSSPRTASPCSATWCSSSCRHEHGAPDRGWWWSTTTTPTPGTSSTWSPR